MREVSNKILNMVSGLNTLAMEIVILASMSGINLKAKASTFGAMELCTWESLKKETGMTKASGRLKGTFLKSTLVFILETKNKEVESIVGQMDQFMKATSTTT